MCAWTAGDDKVTGLLVTASIWNSYLGTTGSLQYLKTKELYVPVTYTTGVMGTYGGAPIARLANDSEDAEMSFIVPDDFLTLTEAVIIVLPRATQAAANWDIYSQYAAIGEAVNTHTASDLATTYNVTNLQLFEVNVASLLSSLAAGDVGAVRLLQGHTDHDVDVFGFRMKYA